MKKIIVPIFTEEYKIVVFFGATQQRAKMIASYCDGWDYKMALQLAEGTRGTANNTLPDKPPLITIDIDMSYEDILSTLPHEASHAIDYIMDYISMEDSNGEFKGHAISAVVRCSLKGLLGKKKLYAK